MRFPYGAVYFRKTNPPRSDWARDYQTAAEDGLTHFRHWFIWSGIEYVPDEFDWQDYDEHMDLAARNGIGVILAEFVAIPPEWMYLRYPDGRLERADGRKHSSKMHVSATIGGSPGMCLDHDGVRERAGHFLATLVKRYRNHPATAGYNIWNECNTHEDTCHCPATADKFREWLIGKYTSVDRLRTAWGRYYGDWSEVSTPRELGPYGQSMDWLDFRIERAHEHMRWRVDLIRSFDEKNPITAHGVAGTLGFGVSRSTDDWLAAAEVDSYGFTFAHSRRGDSRWKHPLAVEVVRSASREKTFWHTEAQGGPLWLQPQVTGRPLEDGRVTTPDDIRYWNLVSFAGGARGLFYPRWRPLLDGPLFGAFGAYAMDGGRTDRSRQLSTMAKWATDSINQDLWDARPRPDEVALLYVPQSQAFQYLLRGDRKPYERAISGAWRALFDAGFHASFCKIEHLDEHSVLYLPCPLLLPDEVVTALRTWVEAGGVLISEGAPAYFDDHGRVCHQQLGPKLSELFGAEQDDIFFTPDLLEDLSLFGETFTAHGGEVRQTLRTTTGAATGWYADGSVAMVDHQYGRGRTRLIGTSPGIGYSTHSARGTRRLFETTMEWARVRPSVRLSDDRAFARVHTGRDSAFLWLMNPTYQGLETEVDLGETVRFPDAPPIRWGANRALDLRGPTRARVKIGARDAVVVQLDHVSG